jgi:hypothetical protein
MSTLVQIESEVVGLPPQEQWSLLTWLQARLMPVPGSPNLMRGQTQAEIDGWLAELDQLKAKTHTGKEGVPLQQLMDELREDRF